VKKAILVVTASLTLLIGAGSAYAGRDVKSDSDVKGVKGAKGEKGVKGEKGNSGSTSPRAVPEIDATSGSLAIALVLGVGLLGAERLRRSQRAN
jgi:hypothetical protein